MSGWKTETKKRDEVADIAVEAFFEAAIRERGYENVNIPAKLRNALKADAMRTLVIFDILNSTIDADYWSASWSFIEEGERVSFVFLYDTEQEANSCLHTAMQEVTNLNEPWGFGRYDLTKSHPSAFYGEVLPTSKPGA